MSDYYDVDKPFSRENWNTLIRDINEDLENPPSGCPSIEPLEEVDENHIWTKKDIEDVRDKLTEMCPTNEFNEELEIWKTAIIDEIEEKIGVWCGCEPDEIILADETPQFCGTCCDYYNPIPYTTLESVLDGLQVGPPGILGRTYRLWV